MNEDLRWEGMVHSTPWEVYHPGFPLKPPTTNVNNEAETCEEQEEHAENVEAVPAKKTKKTNRSFRPEWLEIYTWLRHDTKLSLEAPSSTLQRQQCTSQPRSHAVNRLQIP